jgi:hypothetical protein
MEQLGKLIMVAALGLLVLGAAVYAAGHLGFRGLPGDLAFEGKGWKVYFPIVSCIVLSVVLTLVLNVIARWGR